MAGIIAIDITEVFRQGLQSNLYSAAGIRYIVSADDDQGTMTCAALRITRQFNGYNFRIRSFYRIIHCHDLRTCTCAAADDADGTEFIQMHSFFEHRIYVCDNEPDGITNRGSYKFCYANPRGCAAGSFAGLGSAEIRFDLVHYFFN